MKKIVCCFMLLLQGCHMKEKNNEIKEHATFAGGCFWCIQPSFERIHGVLSAVVGYANGKEANPTYETYAQKGYVEAIDILFDPHMITYATLVDIFLHQINPMDAGGQFADRGPAYRPVIFYYNEQQKIAAEQLLYSLEASGIFPQPLNVELQQFTNFYPAEQYHQQYHEKNPTRYQEYRKASGRDEFLQKIWNSH